MDCMRRRDFPLFFSGFLVLLQVLVACVLVDFSRTYHDSLTLGHLVPWKFHNCLGKSTERYSVVKILESIHSGERCAVLFSPYHFSPGGGEKYFLEVAAFYQRAQYEVTIMTDTSNICENKECVLNTASKLGANLSDSFNYFRVDHRDATTLLKCPVDQYYEMGNSKYPQHANGGKIGIYQCQFPFDANKSGTDLNVQHLSTYDLVLVNSEYTKYNYLQATQAEMLYYREQEVKYPDVAVLYPPVSFEKRPIPPKTTLSPPLKVAMLGRIFDGRQSKGHRSAIEAFRRIRERTDLFELHIIGEVHPGFGNYSNFLQKTSQNLPVFFHLGVSRKEVFDILDSSTIMWHLTGMEADGDAASYEHFGISPVEGMSRGLVPIVYFKGGVVEATEGCGLQISSIASLVDATLSFQHISSTEIAAKQGRCRGAANAFADSRFHERYQRITVRSLLTQRFTELLADFPMTSRSYLPSNTRKLYTAYIYLTSAPYFLPSVINNVIGHLGDQWNLTIGVMPSNLELVSLALIEDFPDAHFIVHSDLSGSSQAYSKMMMSVEFWDLFETEHVLVFQSDTIFFYGNMEYFVSAGYPFLGAPWCPDNEVVSKGIVPWRIGNGGFSLRRKSWMKRCVESSDVIEKYQQVKEVHGSSSGALEADNEDIFFSICMAHFETPDKLIEILAAAKRFAVEVPCNITDIMHDPPMAAHALWYYASGADMRPILRSVKVLQASRQI